MVYVLGQLKLENYDKWKPVFDKRYTIRKESGSIKAWLFRDSDDQNEVVIMFEWDNMENARKYFESESLQKSLQKAGAKMIKTTYLDQIEATI